MRLASAADNQASSGFSARCVTGTDPMRFPGSRPILIVILIIIAQRSLFGVSTGYRVAQWAEGLRLRLRTGLARLPRPAPPKNEPVRTCVIFNPTARGE